MLEYFSFQISCWAGGFKTMLQCFCAAGGWTWSRRVWRSFSVSSSCFLLSPDSPVCVNKSVKTAQSVPTVCETVHLHLQSKGVSPPPLCLIAKVKYFKHTHLSQRLFLETHQLVWWHWTVYRSCFHLPVSAAEVWNRNSNFALHTDSLPACTQSLLRPDWSVRPETRKLLIPSVSSAEWTEMSEQRSVCAQCLGLIEATSGLIQGTSPW